MQAEKPLPLCCLLSRQSIVRTMQCYVLDLAPLWVRFPLLIANLVMLKSDIVLKIANAPQARVQYLKDLKSGKNKGMATMAWMQTLAAAHSNGC